MRYLKVSFEGAKLFRVHLGTKDFVISKDVNGITSVESRIEAQPENFESPITVYQVSNLIHVLFGERPVPTFRSVCYGIIDYYFDKAMDSYLLIDTYKHLNSKTGVSTYPTEVISTKKAVYNSYKKIVNISWFTIRKYLRYNNGVDTYYDEFISKCNILFNINVEAISFEYLRNLFLSDKYDTKDIIDFLSSRKKTGLSNYLMSNCTTKSGIKVTKDGSEITKNYVNDTVRCENNGLDTVSVLSGSILIPVTDLDIERLRKVSTGVGTMLDGGFAYIDSILEDYEVEDFDSYDKVGGISLKKVTYAVKDKIKE